MISADDFGANQMTNAAIYDLLKKNAIDRVGVLICEKISPNDIDDLLQSNAKIDLHLEIPLLHKKKKLYGTVLGRGIVFLSLFLLGKLSPDVIFAEWDRQIKLFHHKFGRMPDGLNSHEHIHLFPPFFTVICKLALHHHIPFVRCSTLGMIPARNIKRVILHMLWAHDHKILRTRYQTITTSTYLASMDWLAYDNTSQLTSLPPDTEIISHPARKEEFDLLCSIIR